MRFGRVSATLVLALALCSSACGPKKPPVVKPSPPPGPVVTEQIHTGIVCKDGKFFTTTGQPFVMRGCSGCCMEGAQGWPCSTAPYMTWAKETGGCNVMEFRFNFTEASESEWKGIGGPWVEVDGKADLTKPNEAFHAKIENAIDHAGAVLGMIVVLDPFDGWRIKHCQWGEDVGCVLRSDGNVQGQDWLTGAGRTEIKDGTFWADHLRWLAKRYGRYRNVAWLTGNENGQIDGFRPEWDLSIRNVILDEYARNGWPAPLIITNSDSDVVDYAPGIDVVARHTGGVIDPVPGKCTINSEFNPNPPWTAKVWQAIRSQTEAAGAWLWAWRHGQSEEEWLKTLAALKGPADPNPEACPFPVPETVYAHCKDHSAWEDGRRWDCTPQQRRQPGGAPVWPEDALRPACEAKSTGGAPTLSLTRTSGDLALTQLGNPWQFKLSGAGAGILHCSIPAKPGVDICGYEVSR